VRVFLEPVGFFQQFDSFPAKHSIRASAYEELKKWDEAISDYDQRIELLPNRAANAYLHRCARNISQRQT
jgi:predicted RNA polymerase sigma factor